MESKINNSRSLVRFEFLECLIRISLAKYKTAKTADNVVEGIVRLLKDNLQAHLPQMVSGGKPSSPKPCSLLTVFDPLSIAQAATSPNVFRKERLYTRAVHLLFKPHLKELRLIFKHFTINEVCECCLGGVLANHNSACLWPSCFGLADGIITQENDAWAG